MSTAQRVQDHLRGNCKIFREGKQWRTSSPLRENSDDNSFSIRFESDEFGFWQDHVSKESGTLYQLAARLDINTPERTSVESTKRAYEGLADYAKAHGVSEEVYRAAGWFETEKHGRQAIAFKTANGNRYRFLDDQSPRYINDAGYETCWYGLKRAIAMAKERNLPLILCNGEASTVVAQHFGLPACARTNGEGKLPEPLVDELQRKWTGRVVIALDCDDTGRQAAVAIREQIENSVIVDLKLSEHGDLADWCKLRGEESLDDLLDMVPPAPVRKSSASLAKERLARVYSAMATPGAIRGLKTGMPSIDKALSGLVGGRSVCLYGDTGMGKSTLCASWAVNLGKQAPGLIFTTEIHGEAYLDKLACAMARVPFHKLEDGLLSRDELERIEDAFHSLEKMHIQFEDMVSSPDAIVPLIESAQHSWGCGWVMIDSLSKLADGVDYEQVTKAANAAQEACNKTKLPIIITSQVGRNLKSRSNKVPTLHDAQGSGMIEQNADVVLSLYNHNYYVTRGEAEPDENFPEGTTAIICLKDRWRGNTGKAWRVTNVAGASFYESARESKEASA